MCTLTSLVTLALLVSCGTETGELPLAPGSMASLQAGGDPPPQFTAWSAPVNLGPVVNSDAADIEVTISKDGLSLYFASDRAGGFGRQDIWVSRRASVDDPWGAPQNLGPMINTASDDRAPMLTVDGHRLFFSSDRGGGSEVYLSRRRDKRDSFGWRPPENVGAAVNSAGAGLPFYFEDPVTGTATLFFNSGRPGGLGSTDIYASTLQPDETFGPAVLVPELSSPLRDAKVSIRRDGLELFLTSDRTGTLGSFDVWVATRATTNDPWSTPVNLGPVVNSTADEGRIALSFDGTTLYVMGTRPGGVGRQDIWMSTRTRSGDDNDDADIDTDDADDDSDVPRYSDWSAPVNLGPIVNTAFVDTDPFITKDGLSLYFVAGRGRGGSGLRDIWVSQRGSINDPWAPPQNLGPTINSAGHDDAPTLSLDGHRLYFASSRGGGFGGLDLYVSRRRDKRDNFGWEAPVNVGGSVNTTTDETSPTFFEDGATGTVIMYFTSNRPGGHGLDDIYASTLHPDGTFGSAVLVAELSTPFNDGQPAIRRDGLEMFLGSDRPGTIGNTDLWVATRARTIDPWSAPVNLGPVINSPPRPPDLEQANDFGPALSLDGTALYFASAFRPGNVSDMFDLWVSTRTKLRGPD
jgi:hypothetical protein